MGYKVRAGVWGAGDMGDEYLVRALPAVGDQRGYVRWLDPSRDGSWYRPFRRLVEALDGALYAEGDGEGRWTFAYWTRGMFAAWQSWFCAGEYSGTCTIETLRADTGAFGVFVVTLQLPDPAGLARAPGGYRDVEVKLVNGVEAGS